MPGIGNFLKTAGRALFTGRMQTGTKIGLEGFGDFVGASRNSIMAMAPKGAYMGSSGIKTLGGALLKQTLPYYAIGSGIDYVLDETRAGEEMSGAQRFGMQALSLGFKLNAARHLVRGATGSALYGAGAVVGNPAKFASQYKWVEGKLAQGAAAAVKLPFKAAGAAAKLPFKMALGMPYALASGVRAGGNLVGSALFGRYGAVGAGLRGAAFYGPGKLLEKAGMKAAGRAWAGVGHSAADMSARFFESRPSIGHQLEPSLGGFLRSRPFSWVPGASKLGGTSFMQRSAPTMYGFAALGAGAAVAQSYSRYKNDSRGWVSGGISPNPQNYGGGISVLRRGPAANYGPALTLMLHQNHSRRM